MTRHNKGHSVEEVIKCKACTFQTGHLIGSKRIYRNVDVELTEEGVEIICKCDNRLEFISVTI